MEFLWFHIGRDILPQIPHPGYICIHNSALLYFDPCFGCHFIYPLSLVRELLSYGAGGGNSPVRRVNNREKKYGKTWSCSRKDKSLLLTFAKDLRNLNSYYINFEYNVQKRPILEQGFRIGNFRTLHFKSAENSWKFKESFQKCAGWI